MRVIGPPRRGTRSDPRTTRRSGRIPGQLTLFAIGAAANAAAFVQWMTHGGPAVAVERGFIGSVPLTIVGVVLVTAALLRPAREREARRVAELELLRRAAHRMTGAPSVGAIGRTIVEETAALIPYHTARVDVVEPPDVLLPVAFEGPAPGGHVDLDRLRTRVGAGFAGWVAQHGRPLRIDDANVDPRATMEPGRDEAGRSLLVVPMLHDATVVGVISLTRLGVRQYDDDELRLLSIVADQAATAVASSRLFAETRRLASDLRRLVDMSSDLSGSLDPRQVAGRIAQHIGRALDADEAAISWWDRDGDRLVTSGYWPAAAEVEQADSFSLAAYPLTRSVLDEQRIVTVQVDDPDADKAEVRLLREQGMRSVVMLPLVAKGEAVGLVELLSRAGTIPDDRRVELAQTMANEAAMAFENARLYEQARRLADRDPLTGFFNHRYLHERLGEEVVRAQRTRRPLSVLMLDLDDFKVVNDTFGHLFGDLVLVHVAERIRSALRAHDVPARYGGDEFAVILPETDAEAAARVAARVAEALSTAPYEADGRLPVAVGVSVGGATYPAQGRTATELIATADAALYASKGDDSPSSPADGVVRRSAGGSEAA